MMLILVLLSWSCSLTRTQRLDPDSQEDQDRLSEGLCRYGNSVECCWGWRRTERGRCQPHCQHGCKHGDCVGPDRCKCHPGYTGKACNQDLNECGLNPRPCKHRCMNTPGSFKCFCLDGFSLQTDGGCRNVRTCYHANCQYGCEVMKGRVRCTCPSPGLRLGPDRRSCVDVNECVSGAAVCPRHRKCINTFGSFVCRCHPGFKLTYINGRYACIDKDTRPFCSLNPSSPKCGCEDGSCRVVLKVTLEPQRLRTTTKLPTAGPTTTVRLTTATIATTSLAPSIVAVTTTKTPPITAVLSTVTVSTLPTTTEMDTKTTTLTTTPSTTPMMTTTPSTTPSTTTPMMTTTPSTTTPIMTTTLMMTTTPLTTPLTTTTLMMTTTPLTTSTAPPVTSLPTTTETDTTTPNTPLITTVAVTTTMLTTSSLVTTTLDNRINKDVTQRQRGDVHIPRQPSYNHVWEFDVELGNTAEDVGDDPEVSVLRCSFDHGLCDWISDRDGDLYWETVKTPAGEQYLSVSELKAGQRSVRGARLAIQIVPPWRQGDLCLSFSHWLTGRHVGVLQLFVRKTGRDQRYGSALWSRTGGHGWRQTQVTMATLSVDKVLIKAERMRGRGQIAVDDVTLRQGACR